MIPMINIFCKKLKKIYIKIYNKKIYFFSYKIKVSWFYAAISNLLIFWYSFSITIWFSVVKKQNKKNESLLWDKYESWCQLLKLQIWSEIVLFFN